MSTLTIVLLIVALFVVVGLSLARIASRKTPTPVVPIIRHSHARENARRMRQNALGQLSFHNVDANAVMLHGSKRRDVDGNLLTPELLAAKQRANEAIYSALNRGI